MQVFKISEAIENKYKGAGCALAAVSNGAIVDLVYVSDFCLEFSGNLEDLPPFMDSPEFGRKVREFQALGEVFLGMCSAWEFVVL